MRETSGDDRDWWGAELLARHPAGALWAQAGHEVTYQRLRTRTADFRALFRAHGIGPGSTVALQGTPSFSQLWSVLALWSLDAQVMLMGQDIRGRELGRLLDRCRPQYHVAFDAPTRFPRAFHDECEVLVRRMRGGRPATADHCLVHFTSGSTGFAKAVGRTPASLLAELDTFRRVGGMPGPGSRVLLLGPVAHSFNLVGGLLHNMNTGAVTVFPTRTGRPAALRTAIRSRVDTVLGTTEHFTQLALGDRAVRVPGLRRAVSGGDRLDDRVHARFAERYGVRIGQAYGTTETGIVAADPTGWYGPGTVGMVVPGVQVRVLAGELQVRMERNPYLAQEAPPARFLADGPLDGPGWLCTRDRAAFDPAGALRILGRIDPSADRVALTRGTDRILLADRTAGRALTRSGRPSS
ncbi:class I adenylate-forming enzyme family protein [Streptomyces sp. WAC06614]|uniref:class I adenylate-forming enzyme family protein n=1 Tax=Streptomyces sp. WAC06614 TaxID=2487416 RepID=UPI000F78A1B3|nr:AMP-binding protein [Streptomyces sp. WAC06614]RSS72257.1 long-chain fatty acid--CoA ligase [Streptomyces sp. WAC06614]